MLEALSKIGFDWQLSLANLANFIVVFFVLKALVFKPIQEGIDARQQKVAQTLEDSKVAAEALAQATEKSNEILREAKVQATEIVSAASSKANMIEENAAKVVAEEKVKMIAGAEKEIARMEKEMNSKLAESATELAIMAAEKIIQEDMDESSRGKYTAKMSK